MRIDLKQHNQIAYNKVMRDFETKRVTCVCHPTGTGKSYIVAAVCEHFGNVLILAPSHFVLRQQADILKWHVGVDFFTYPYVMYSGQFITKKYDLIVLDEFHRVGAPEWGHAINELLKAQPQAKVLGTSATPVRHYEARNMADDLFDGNIASEMSVAEAWSRGVLPIPTYVTGYFRFEKMVNAATERINELDIPEENKRERIFKLSNARLEWDNSMGMSKILQRHLPSDLQRMIVFCDHIDSILAMMGDVKKWMKNAGFEVGGSYFVHCKMNDSEKSHAFSAFSKPVCNGVKIIFAVNMLNEGVHVPNVGAVLMLRTTSSPTIFYQQMGRVLTAANTEKPVVLDMVDNITTTSAIKELKEEYTQLMQNRSDLSNESRKFEVFDYKMSVKQLIEQLTRTRYFYTKDERKAILIPWVKEHGRTPRYGIDMDVYCHWVWLKNFALDDEEVYDIYKNYAPKSELDARIESIAEFYEKNNRMPRTNKDDKMENRLRNIWLTLIRTCRNHPSVQAIWKRNRDDRKREREEQIKRCVEVCAKILDDGGSPKDVRKTKEYRVLKQRNLKSNQLVSQFMHRLNNGKSVGKTPSKTIDQWAEVFEKLLKKNRGEITRKDGLVVYSKWRHTIKHHSEHPKIKKLMKMHRPVDRLEKNKQLSYQLAMDFYQTHGRMVFPSDDSQLYNKVRYFIRTNPDDPRAQELQRLKGKVNPSA